MTRVGSERQTEPAPLPPSLFERWTWWTIVAFAIAVPLLVSTTSSESFRLPKELLFRMQAILLLVLGGLELSDRRPDARSLREHRPIWGPALLAGSWAVICTLAATNPRLSAGSLMTIACSMVIFVVTALVAPRQRFFAIYALTAPAVINAVVFLIETVHRTGVDDVRTALLGNRDDVGSFLVVAGIVALGAGMADRTPGRWVHLAAAVVIAAAVLVGALTSVIAYIIATLLLATLSSRKFGLALTLVLLGMLAGSLAVPRVRTRVDSVAAALRQGDWNDLTSGRMVAAYAAGRMFLARPLTGVGPGCFGREYFDYKVSVERDHPTVLSSPARHRSFGEVHNDHLQVLAETGIIGYAILLLILALVARNRWLAKGNDARLVFVRITSLPLVTVFAVDALGHFPLELAAPRAAYLFAAALCMGWSNRSADSHHAHEAPGTMRTPRVAIAAALAAGMIWFFVYDPFRCSVLTARAKRRALLAATHESSTMSPALARASLEDIKGCSVGNKYEDIELLMVRAADDRLLNRLAEAERDYRTAIDISPRPELFLNLGLVLLQQGKPAEARALLLQAVVFDYDLLAEIEYPPEHDRIEHIINLRYPWIFPEGRAPTYMIPDP